MADGSDLTVDGSASLVAGDSSDLLLIADQTPADDVSFNCSQTVALAAVESCSRSAVCESVCVLGSSSCTSKHHLACISLE